MRRHSIMDYVTLRSYTLLSLISCIPAVSQQASYLITTVVGGARPVTPAPAASVWAPGTAVAVDQIGDIFLSVQTWHTVFKLDNTGSVTVVAGIGSPG